MRQQWVRGFWGLAAFCAFTPFVCASDFGTVDVLHPYSDQIVVEQGDQFWFTRPTNPTPSIVEVDMCDGTGGVAIRPGEKVPIRFDRPGKYPIAVTVDGYPERALTVEVMPKSFGSEPPARGVRFMSASALSGPYVSMGSLYAGWYNNACGSTGHKFPMRMVANFSGPVTVNAVGSGGGPIWSGTVTNGDNIIVVNNPSGALWVLFVYQGSVQVSGSQTLSTNTPYRLDITNIVVTTNTLTDTAGTGLAGLQTQVLVKDQVTWKVAPNCWWTYTNICADLFVWSGTNLAASGLTNGAAYTNAGVYPVKVSCHINPAGQSADVAVLDLDKLTLTDAVSPTNTVSDSTPDPLTPVTNTLVLSSAGGTASMTLDLTWQPSSVAYSGSKFKWMTLFCGFVEGDG